MNWFLDPVGRREFCVRLGRMGVVCGAMASLPVAGAEPSGGPPDPLLKFPGPWRLGLPHGAIILVSDAQLEALQEPDREVDISITSTPNRTTLRQICVREQARGARRIIIAFDHFWAQYRAGQGEKPRQLMPDMDAYIQRIARISETLKAYGLGLELSLLSPLELGPGYLAKTGEQGRWVQYREGVRDPATGRYEVQMWEHLLWTNNKGSIEPKRIEARAYAFREQRVGGTPYYIVTPADIRLLSESPVIEPWEGAKVGGGSFAARRITIRGKGDRDAGPLDRVLVVLSYATPEMDYFSPRALPFLKDLVSRYHKAGIPLLGLYADEMHIQQDWVYSGHHDEGQFTVRYLTASMARQFAEEYGAEFADLEKYLVYFCYGQHGFLPSLDARLSAQHVLGAGAEEVQRTFLLRRRYYELLGRTVVGLFAEAKRYAESLYGHELDARAHATWAQSPTIDYWNTGAQAHAPKQYEYTPNFLWGNTVQQASAACDDYFRWNDFLTGGGNDHTEGGWLDRNYYALALGCSTGILNRTPYAYAAHWGMPGPVSERRQALVDAYGASASPPFQAVEESAHRDIEVLMLYPIGLVACEERFGSWMAQYGYCNYVTADRLVAEGKVVPGAIELAGRRFATLAALFEPFPPVGLLPMLEAFVKNGGRLVWSGPPPRFDMAGKPILAQWQALFGVQTLHFGQQGVLAPGEQIEFAGALKAVPTQSVLTDFLVDHLYPVMPVAGTEVVARSGKRIVGLHRRLEGAGQCVYLGFRPRDDQAASLGYPVRTWFEILRSLGAYPATREGMAVNDNPSVVSRETPYLACRFPNGTIALARHYHDHVESWPGGFHRDPKQDAAALEQNPLPSDRLELKEFAVAGKRVAYTGRLAVAFRLGPGDALLAFAGYDCSGITLNGVEHRFSEKPMPMLAWAPVAESRRVPGGAVAELWLHGVGTVAVPWPVQHGRVRLFMAGGKPGSPGAEVPCTVRDGKLIVDLQAAWQQRHFYVVLSS